MISIFKTLRAIWRRSGWERSLDEEIESHIAMRADDLERSGIPRAAAERQARMELGSRERYKEEVRASYGLRWLDELWQDLRYGARMLLHNKSFSAIAIISLALGVGANAIVFGGLNAVLFKPLPYLASPERFYFLQTDKYPSLSFPNYRDIRDRNTTIEGLTAIRVVAAGLSTDSGVERMFGYLATGNYFDVLGVRPALGRFFHPEDDRVVNGSPWAVLSYSLWQNRFRGDPAIIGRQIRINSLPYTVIGVAPRGFRGTEMFYLPEFWLPMSMQAQVESNAWLEKRTTFNAWINARLKPGISVEQAAADLNRIAAGLAKEYPRINDGLKLRLTKPGFLGDALRPGTEAFMAGLMTLAGLVLLAACANLASMLGARSADRFREIAVRVSIGAGRGRIVRQLLTESVLLTAVGGVVGSALAYQTLRALTGWRPPTGFASQLDVSADVRVWLFAGAITLLAGLIAGIVPARIAWRADVNDALKGGSLSGPRRRRWSTRDALLAVQVALCCVLVTSTIVASRGLRNMLSARAGIDPRGVSVIAFDASLARYSRDETQKLQRRTLDAIATLPGVTAAAYSSGVPLALDQSNTTLYPSGTTEFLPRNSVPAVYYNVSPGYFQAIGTRLLDGRDFDGHDDEKAPRVAIVNQTLARRLTGTANAVGKRIFYDPNVTLQIVAVVEDGKYEQLTEEQQGALFRPALQDYSPTTVVVARTSFDEFALAERMREEFEKLDRTVPVYASSSLIQYIGIAFLPAMIATVALSAFGVLAAMLAITGIYGLAGYNVSRRLREIGIRMAVGAQAADVLRFVLGRTAMLVFVGAAVGIALGVAASRVLSNIVYSASSRDPLTILGVAVVMALIGLAAAFGPARRAVSIDPVRALRQD